MRPPDSDIVAFGLSLLTTSRHCRGGSAKYRFVSEVTPSWRRRRKAALAHLWHPEGRWQTTRTLEITLWFLLGAHQSWVKQLLACLSDRQLKIRLGRQIALVPGHYLNCLFVERHVLGLLNSCVIEFYFKGREKVGIRFFQVHKTAPVTEYFCLITVSLADSVQLNTW